jgi:hypothetical protein
MKRLLFLLLSWSIAVVAFSQRVYFIYLQTEQDQPFFVKLNDKIYSSNASGYLILSKLYDTTYNFSVGFPKDKWPEQKFTVDINKKDHGYLLKNFGEKGWGLFDLQTMTVQMGELPQMKTSKIIQSEKKDVSAFADLLSKAADDPGIKEDQVLLSDEKKPVMQIRDTMNKKDPDLIDKTNIKKEEKLEMKDHHLDKTEDVKPAIDKPFKKTKVTRKAESSTTEGLGLVFIDEYPEGGQDTIRLLIPHSKSFEHIINDDKKEEKTKIEFLPDSSKKISGQVSMGEENRKLTKAAPREKCKELASDGDFLKLRKNMAAKNDDEGMLDEARKYFKTKCFTTEQVKNLSFLFLNDEGKYKFFDAAYNYTSDREKFSSLQLELKEEYYINRFKAMLRN